MTNYRSPLREAQREATRERILESCARLVAQRQELTYAAVAGAAGVQERTVYRHFPTKDDLEQAFWWWQSARLGHPTFAAGTLDELVAAMRVSFAGFDREAHVVEAMLASEQGMAIRQKGSAARRKMFLACTADATAGLDARTRRRAAAAAQLLYSAPAWQMLRRFWDMDGEEAAETIDLALRALCAGVRTLARTKHAH